MAPDGKRKQTKQRHSAGELKKTRSDIQVLEDRFRGFLEAAPDAIIIVDRDGRIILVNSQTETLFGYTREELLGKTVEHLVPGRFRDNHPVHRDGFFVEPRIRPMGAGLNLYGLK